MGKNKMLLGRLGEAAALQYLLEKGYSVLKSNYRCKLGEIDIVAAKGGYVIFIEVKTRSSDAFGCALECIPAEKQRKIKKVAIHYLISNGGFNSPVRFDVLAVKPCCGGQAAVAEHIINAF